MDIIRNSVWLSQGTDLLAEGLYRVLDFDRKVDLLILFKIKSERTGKPIPFSFSMFKYYIESNSITCKDYIYTNLAGYMVKILKRTGKMNLIH